jgi:hypothetical protein
MQGASAQRQGIGSGAVPPEESKQWSSCLLQHSHLRYWHKRPDVLCGRNACLFVPFLKQAHWSLRIRLQGECWCGSLNLLDILFIDKKGLITCILEGHVWIKEKSWLTVPGALESSNVSWDWGRLWTEVLVPVSVVGPERNQMHSKKHMLWPHEICNLHYICF